MPKDDKPVTSSVGQVTNDDKSGDKVAVGSDQTGNIEWSDKLEKFIKTYNETPHSDIDGMTANEAEQYIKTTMDVNLAKAKRMRKPKFKIGDKVRFKLLKGVFEKGYTRTYSKEVHTISEHPRQ